MLTLDGVVAGYGRTACLKGISLEVHAGEIVALLGANGAGKTTTLMTISGLVRIREGRASFDGARLNHLSPEHIAALGIGHVPEGRRIFPRLTVLENLELGAFLRRDRAAVAYGVWHFLRRPQRPLWCPPRSAVAQDLARVFELFPVLRDRRPQLAGTLSGGEQQMLAIARGLMARPKLLLLDEPSLGLAPKLVQEVFRVITQINRTGIPILLVEQNARMALTVAHRGYILETGAITMAETARALADNPQVKAAYLGG